MVAPEWAQANCGKCEYWRVHRYKSVKMQVCDEAAICVDAADRIEQLEAENAALRAKLSGDEI